MNERYSRQILYGPIGPEGQKRLLNSRVLIIGCGALGAAHAEALARAGVGFLRLADRDFVELSNLQRQTLYSEMDAADGTPKAIAAEARLKAINSEVSIDPHVVEVNHTNIDALLEGIDLVLDGTDNFQIRYLINDACVKNETPWIYGAAVAGYGTTMTILPNTTSCLRCIFEEMPPAGSSPTCDTAGVLQSIISSVSAVQVTEAIKLLIGAKSTLHGSLLQIDIWNSDWRKIKANQRNPNCRTCGARDFEFLNAESNNLAISLCGRDAIQVRPPNADKIDLKLLNERLKNLGNTRANEYLIRFSNEEVELTVFADGRAIIKGTDEPSEARSLYSKFIGN